VLTSPASFPAESVWPTRSRDPSEPWDDLNGLGSVLADAANG